MKSKVINIKGISFKGDKISYTAPSWEEMGEYCFLLAQKILASGQEFDRLVTLAKGGWTWARNMSDLLSIEKVASVQLIHYSDVYETGKKPRLIQSLPVSVVGEKILIFDDVTDSGKSLPFCMDYLKMCGAGDLTTSTLFYKPWSIFKPDFYVCQTKAWIIFPHELRETVESRGKKWIEDGCSKQEVVERFVKIGLPKEQVEYFSKK